MLSICRLAMTGFIMHVMCTPEEASFIGLYCYSTATIYPLICQIYYWEKQIATPINRWMRKWVKDTTKPVV